MDSTYLLAYFAGAIDADGYISIQRSTRKMGARYAHQPTYYAARIGFTGTAVPRVQALLQERFGGSLYTHRPKNALHKPWCVWAAEGKQAEAALRAIGPYLINKAEQAALALALIKLKSDQWEEVKRTQKPPYHITDEMNSLRHALWEGCTKLNNPRNRTVHFLDEGGGPFPTPE